MITACLILYKTTGDEKFLTFSKNFLDYFVKDHGVIETYEMCIRDSLRPWRRFPRSAH